MRILSQLFQPVSIYSLVVFRIIFGLTMIWEVSRYFAHDWIARYWIDPVYNFTYEGFHWLNPWPGDGMYYHFLVLGLLAVFITLGLAYRVSSALFFMGFTYTFLLEQARYMNHFYLVVLLSFLLIFLPANRYFSLDARLFPKIKSQWVPRWSLLLIQMQLGLVYFFGGVAKMNLDWLRGEPMRMWLARRTDFPVIGSFFTEEWMIYIFAYGGLLLDLLAFPLLAFRKTRPWIFLGLLLFHFINDRLFSIGIFPWFAIGLTTIFFPADWPQQLYQQVKKKPLLVGAIALLGALLARYFHSDAELFPQAIGALAGALLVTTFLPSGTSSTSAEAEKIVIPGYRNWVVGGMAIWFFIQTLVPLRHLFIPGNVSWTEEGHRFAWHMKLRSKQGDAIFFTYDPATDERRGIPLDMFLTDWQYRKMVTRPYLIRQFAQYLQTQYPGVEIRAAVECELNGRDRQLLIDPNINLLAVPYSDWRHQTWIYPLEKPLLAND